VLQSAGGTGIFAVDALLRGRYFYRLTNSQPTNHRQPNKQMANDKFKHLFTPPLLLELFPADRSDRFFEALYGDIEEGAYDISLEYEGYNDRDHALHFLFKLTERPGKCLACHLTYGLPEVFARHPLIGVTGLVKEIDRRIGDLGDCGEWRLESTRTISRKISGVPLTVTLR